MECICVFIRVKKKIVSDTDTSLYFPGISYTEFKCVDIANLIRQWQIRNMIQIPGGFL